MFKVTMHGDCHYRRVCRNCCCIFEYDKTDIKDYIENDEKVFKIRCPECGNPIKIEEGGKNAGN